VHSKLVIDKRSLLPIQQLNTNVHSETNSELTSGYATMVHGRGCNPHRSMTTFAKPEMTSWMTS